MRILYLQQYLTMPGCRGNARCWEMATHFANMGHEVTFITAPMVSVRRENGFEEQRSFQACEHERVKTFVVDVDGGHMLSFPRRIISWLRFYRKAWSLANKLGLDRFDVIIGYTAPLTMAALAERLSKKSGVPFCMEVADVWPDVPIGMGVVKNRLLARMLLGRTNLIYDNAKMIFPYTEGMREQILSHGDYSAKVCVLHNGVDCNAVVFRDRSSREGVVKVLYAGTIGKANDLTQFMRAIKIIEDTGRRDIEFNIVGVGNDEERVKACASLIGVTTVRFYPAVGVEEMPSVLDGADIGVSCVASYPVLEANGATKFFDYLAAGLPLVINHEGWQSEYLQKNSCGLSSPQGDENAFAKNILKLVDSPELRAQYAKNGRALAEKAFDRNKIALRYIGHLQDIVSKKL